MKQSICNLCGEYTGNILEHHIDYKKQITIKLCAPCHGIIHEFISYAKTKRNDKLILIKCHRCSYQWNYAGNSPFYACCPKCYRKVNIRKYKQ